MPPRPNSTISSSSGPMISAQYSVTCDRNSSSTQIDDRADHRAEQRAHAAEDHHHHEIAGAGPVHHGRADEIGVVGEQRAGEPAHRARDDEADEPVARGGKADRLHALLVGAQALHHQAEARIDDAPDQEDPAEQTGEAEIIELHAVRQIDQAAEIAALVDGQAVVAAVTGEPGGDVIGHLREGERDHDEIDAAGAQRERADHQREQRRRRQRHRPLDEAGADAFGARECRPRSRRCRDRRRGRSSSCRHSP